MHVAQQAENNYVAANRAIWNSWTQRDLASEHHADAATFRSGGLSLRPIEREALGDVRGKSLLHLLCNMGSDTLSWARLGARVTGVDISDAAIERARAMAAEAGLSSARFLRSDLYALPSMLDEQFDIVFTSYGALCWMPDLTRWAEVVACYVRPGGTVFMVDMHPATGVFDTSQPDPTGLTFHVKHPYFHSPDPIPETVRADAGQPDTVYAWSYGLGEVLTASIQAGLSIQEVREHPLTFYQQFPALVRGDDGYWRWPTPDNTLPLLFSLRATR